MMLLSSQYSCVFVFLIRVNHKKSGNRERSNVQDKGFLLKKVITAYNVVFQDILYYNQDNGKHSAKNDDKTGTDRHGG